MRSVINRASPTGVAAIVAQQFDVGRRRSPSAASCQFSNPKCQSRVPTKAGAEPLLRDAILAGLEALPPGIKVMLKLTIPDTSDFYAPLINHPRVVRVVALSGGYYPRRSVSTPRDQSRHDRELFSRPGRRSAKSMTDAEFNAALAKAIDETYRASTVKTAN